MREMEQIPAVKGDGGTDPGLFPRTTCKFIWEDPASVLLSKHKFCFYNNLISYSKKKKKKEKVFYLIILWLWMAVLSAGSACGDRV